MNAERNYQTRLKQLFLDRILCPLCFFCVALWLSYKFSCDFYWSLVGLSMLYRWGCWKENIKNKIKCFRLLLHTSHQNIDGRIDQHKCVIILSRSAVSSADDSGSRNNWPESRCNNLTFLASLSCLAKRLRAWNGAQIQDNHLLISFSQGFTYFWYYYTICTYEIFAHMQTHASLCYNLCIYCI